MAFLSQLLLCFFIYKEGKVWRDRALEIKKKSKAFNKSHSPESYPEEGLWNDGRVESTRNVSPHPDN